MASISKQPGGRWRARYRDQAGKEHAKHFARKVDATRWLDEVTAAIVTGQYVDPNADRVTFREYAEQWRVIQAHRASSQAQSRRCCAGTPTRPSVTCPSPRCSRHTSRAG